MSNPTPGTDNAHGPTHDPVEDAVEIERHARLCLEAGGPGTVIEARLLEYGTGNYKSTASGFFDDAAELAARVAPKAPYAKGVYITVNPLHPGLLARACNCIETTAAKGFAAKDSEVLARKWLLLDLDAIRPTGIPSSDVEHEAALERTRKIRDYLMMSLGWPAPLLADSGNGGHCMWRVDLPVADEGLIQGCLEALAARFDDAAVKVDRTVHNPSRIWKLYGTVARKGQGIPGRPRRLSRILDLPAPLVVVTREQLEALAAEAPAVAATPTKGPSSPMRVSAPTALGMTSRLEAWLSDVGIEHKTPFTDAQGRRIINLVSCPFDSSHGGTSVCVGEMPSGAPFFRCHHNSCADRKWKDVKRLFDKPTTPKTTSSTLSDPAHAAPKFDTRVAKLGLALSQLPDDPTAWRWAGSMAARRGVVVAAREAVPVGQHASYDAGAAAHATGDRVPRPSITEAVAMKIGRALMALSHTPTGAGSAELGFEILDLVRRTNGEGHVSSFELVIGSNAGGAVHVGPFDPKAVLQYEAVRAAAFGQGLSMPALGRAGNEMWGPIIAAAQENERVEAPVTGEVLDDALEHTLRRVLRDADRGTKVEDLKVGHVLVHAGRLIVFADAVLRLVKRALSEDRFERVDLARVARRLGLVDRPALPDGTRPHGLWSFPSNASDEATS